MCYDVFHYLPSEVTPYHFCLSLQVAETNLSTVWEAPHRV